MSFTQKDLQAPIMGLAWMILGILLVIRNNNSTPLWPKITLLLLFGLVLMDNLIKPSTAGETIRSIVFPISRNCYFLIGPFLYFYSCSLLSQDISGWSKSLHLLPYFIFTALKVIFPELNIPPDRFLFPGTAQESCYTQIAFGLFIDMLSLLSQISYGLIIIRLIFIRSKREPYFFSKKSIKNPLTWLFYLLVFYVLLILINEAFLLSPLVRTGHLFFSAALTRQVPSILFMFLFSLFMDDQKNSTKAIKEIESLTSQEENKYKKSGLTDDESQKLYKTLTSYLSEKKSFLNPDLTLEILSEEINESRHRLSEVINRESGERFYNYINNFRLKEFIRCLDKNLYPQYTIKAIARECGFKSSSAFYTSFKKELGITPKEYLAQKDDDV
ncbi:MAG: helix-turn-helix transcriptional regulator [Spirochaetales bacterium]|nr:helix-turn-helix transcriptional regulator [Spirochaetales bacterium]